MSLYRLFVPKQAVGANLVYFDLFLPTTSGKTVHVLSVQPVVSGADAVTGVVGADLFLTRTTAVGTGGTAMTFEGTSLTAMTLVCQDGHQALVAGDMSGRLTPSGGATAGAVLGFRSVFTEETSAAAYAIGPDLVMSGSIAVPNGSGIRVVQGSVASVGNIGFDVTLCVSPRP